MNGSAYQLMRTEIHQLQRELAAKDEHIQKLIATLHQRDSGIVNLNTTVAALLYVSRPHAPEAPAPRGIKRLSRLSRKARQRVPSRPEQGSITIPKTLIDEIASSPFLFEASQIRNPETGDITLSARRRSAAELAELQAQIEKEQLAAQEAARQQQAEAKTAIVTPDGRPAREGAGKLVVVQ